MKMHGGLPGTFPLSNPINHLIQPFELRLIRLILLKLALPTPTINILLHLMRRRLLTNNISRGDGLAGLGQS